VLELGGDRARRRLGPDILETPPRIGDVLARLRGEPADRAVGDALLDQRLVSGIGTVWKAESLWEVRVSPWRPLGELTDEELRAVLDAAHRLMRASLEQTRPIRRIYGRPGRGCPRCGTPIRKWLQGDDARLTFWCPTCQVGEEPLGA
jgi:endonuclease-8